MKYYLAKTDPQTYAISDLAKEKVTEWDGVHNFQALRYIKEMKKGDRVFLYHSQKDTAVVGLAEVVSDPRKNEKDKRTSFVVDLKYIRTYEPGVSLKQIKESGKFNDWLLVRNGRLSVMPVPDTFITFAKKLGFAV